MAAAPGWYPDPDGTPGRFRYWTGSAWGSETTFDPRRPRRRPLPFLVATVVIVAVLGVIAWLVIDNRTSQAVREDPDRIPSSQPTGWDDSSPIPSEDPSPSEQPSAEPSAQPTDVASTRPVGCDQYAETESDSAPVDGRVHGGPLSFDKIAGDWDAPNPSNRFPFSRDGHTQLQPLPEELSWAASAHVGITTLKGHSDGVDATNQLLQCVLTSDFYTSVDVRIAENTTTAIKISGTPAVQRDTLIHFKHPALETTGSRLRITVVESKPRSFFFYAVPKERDDLIADVNRAGDSLQLR